MPTPVDYDPFAQTSSPKGGTPVDYDPFAKNAKSPPQENSDRGFVQGLRDYANQTDDMQAVADKYGKNSGAPDWIRKNVMPVVALPEAITRKGAATAARGVASFVQGTEDIADVAYQKDDPRTRGLNAQIMGGKVPDDINAAMSLGASPFSPKAPIQSVVADAAQAAAKKPIAAGERAATALREGPLRVEPKPGVQAARDAGYVLTPEMASEKPTKLSSALSGVSGDLKLQQLGSVKNQKLTNTFAAQDLGISPDTKLSPEVFSAIRDEEGAHYANVRNAIPEISPTPKFKSEINSFGGDHALMDKHFPDSANHPGITQLRAEFRKMGDVPTDAVVDKIRQLRFEANGNLKKPGAPDAWRLGLAQKDAAGALEDLIDQNIKDAPKYYSRKFFESGSAEKEAAKDVAVLENKLTTRQGKLDTNSNIYVQNKALRQRQGEMQKLAEARGRLNKARAEKDQHLQKLQAAQDPASTEAQLVDRYKQARQRIAKTYDYEGATNPVSGNVNARGLAALAKKGKPLSGHAKTIADAATGFPQVMRNPDDFGGAKEWSVLDFFGTVGALAHGNPGIAAAIVARPGARKLVLSDMFQNMMVPQSKSILRDLGASGEPSAPDIAEQLGLQQ